MMQLFESVFDVESDHLIGCCEGVSDSAQDHQEQTCKNEGTNNINQG